MRVVYTTLLGVSLVTPLVAADWPQWRGPLGTGVSSETGLPEKWNAQSVAWRVKLRGVGVSSPVVAGDRCVRDVANRARQAARGQPSDTRAGPRGGNRRRALAGR